MHLTSFGYMLLGSICIGIALAIILLLKIFGSKDMFKVVKFVDVLIIIVMLCALVILLV